jgi:hypothetical protein
VELEPDAPQRAVATPLSRSALRFFRKIFSKQAWPAAQRRALGPAPLQSGRAYSNVRQVADPSLATSILLNSGASRTS